MQSHEFIIEDLKYKIIRTKEPEVTVLSAKNKSVITIPKYVNYKGIDYYEFLVFAGAIKSKTGVCKEPKKFVFPVSLKHTSSIFAAHEVAHMLKERNPRECKEIIYFGEVIPMLMELIIAYSYEYGSKESVFAQRSKMIKHSCKSFNELYRTYKELSIAEDKKVYETALSEAGTYVNSFYYTLALSTLYIVNKDDKYIRY